MHRDSAATLQRELLALKQKHEATLSSMERQHASKMSEAQSRITDLEEIAMLGEERLMAEQQKAQVLLARSSMSFCGDCEGERVAEPMQMLEADVT